MSNCPKCGNPMQPETDLCPICGTNTISSDNVVTNNEEQSVVPNLVPIVPTSEPAPTQEVTPAEITVEETPVQTEQTSPVIEQTNTVVEVPVVTETPVVEAAPVVEEQPVVAETPVIEAPIEPSVPTVPVVEIAPEPVIATEPIVAPVTSQNEEFVSAETVIESTPPAANTIPETPAPTIEPTPVIEPTVIKEGIKVENETSLDVADKSKKQEKKAKSNNKKTLLLVIIIVAAVGAGMMLLSGGTPTPSAPVVQQPQTNNTVASSSIVSNGFKFDLQKGWYVKEDGNNVIVINSDETVALKLESSKSNFAKLSKELLVSYYNSNETYSNTTVDSTKISAKDAFLINATAGTSYVQSYYINGSNNRVLGATIVYQNDAAKEQYEATVTELIGSISYSDDSLKAISTIELYSTIFGTYNGIFEYEDPNIGTSTEPETPIEENPETPNEPTVENTPELDPEVPEITE